MRAVTVKGTSSSASSARRGESPTMKPPNPTTIPKLRNATLVLLGTAWHSKGTSLANRADSSAVGMVRGQRWGWGSWERCGGGDGDPLLTCWRPLEEGQILAHQVGEEPVAGPQFEPGLRPREETSAAAGEERAGAGKRMGHRDRRQPSRGGQTDGRGGHRDPYLPKSAARTRPMVKAVGPSPPRMASSALPVQYGPAVSPG